MKSIDEFCETLVFNLASEDLRSLINKRIDENKKDFEFIRQLTSACVILKLEQEEKSSLNEGITDCLTTLITESDFTTSIERLLDSTTAEEFVHIELLSEMIRLRPKIASDIIDSLATARCDQYRWWAQLIDNASGPPHLQEA